MNGGLIDRPQLRKIRVAARRRCYLKRHHREGAGGGASLDESSPRRLGPPTAVLGFGTRVCEEEWLVEGAVGLCAHVSSCVTMRPRSVRETSGQRFNYITTISVPPK